MTGSSDIEPAVVPITRTRSPRRCGSSYDDTHQVAEGAGAVATTALMQEAARQRGRRVGVVLSGGNIERARLRIVLDGGTPPVP